MKIPENINIFSRFFFEKDFLEYVVSIEVHKGEVTKLAPLNARIMKHSDDGELTQQDFADGIKVWREYYLDYIIPKMQNYVKDKKNGMSEAALEKKYAKTDDERTDYEVQCEDIVGVVIGAANIDLLDEKNQKALEAAMKEVVDYVQAHPDLAKEMEISGY